MAKAKPAKATKTTAKKKRVKTPKTTNANVGVGGQTTTTTTQTATQGQTTATGSSSGQTGPVLRPATPFNWVPMALIMALLVVVVIAIAIGGSWWLSSHGKSIDGVKNDVTSVKTDIAGVKTGLDTVKTDVSSVATKVGELKTSIDGLKNTTNDRMGAFDGRIEARVQAAKEAAIAEMKKVLPELSSPRSAPTVKRMAPVIPASEIVADFMKAPATSEEAVAELSSRDDAVAAMLDLYSSGSPADKAKARAWFKANIDVARKCLNEALNNYGNWRPAHRAAARDLLNAGYKDNLGADEVRENHSRRLNGLEEGAKQLIRQLQANGQVLNKINARILLLEQRANELTRNREEIRHIANELTDLKKSAQGLKTENADIRAELKAKYGVKPEFHSETKVFLVPASTSVEAAPAPSWCE